MPEIVEINGKYYDFGTDNESFLTTAAELKTLGIQNYYFMLEIINPEAAFIDPYSPNLTRQQIQVCALEAKKNMWYFCRQISKLRTDAGIYRLAIHRGLAAAFWAFQHNYDFCLCEPRQTWKTSGIIAGPLLWAFQTSQDVKLHMFGKDSVNTKRNLATMKEDIELLPDWLRQDTYRDASGRIKKNRPSAQILKNPNLKNDCIIYPSANSLAKAQGMGRGATATILCCDEIEHTPWFPEILSNSAPAFKTAADNAKLAGKPYGRVMMTTPGNLDTTEGRATMPVIKSMVPWTEKVYDMNIDSLEEYKSIYKDRYANDMELSGSGRQVIDVFYMEYRYDQVRKDHAWVMEQYKLSGDKMAIRREILLQRLRGSSDSPISADDIEYFISNMRVAEKELLVHNKWLFKLFNHGQQQINGRGDLPDFDPRIPYFIGIDPAGGGGGDNFAITIVNPYNLEIAAEFKNPYLDCPMAVTLIITLIQEYMPRGILIPERNSIGQYLIQQLRISVVRDHIYWDERDDAITKLAEETQEEFELRSFAVDGRKYGTFTSNKVKQAMFELLFQMINSAKHLLRTEYLVNDMCQLVRDRTKRGDTTYRATKGAHDDNLMSYLHILYVRFTGNNLADFGLYVDELPSIIGDIEVDENATYAIKENPIDIFKDTPNNSYEKQMMECIIANDAYDKYATNTSLNITSEYIDNMMSRSDDPYNTNNNEIPMHWFDMMNN